MSTHWRFLHLAWLVCLAVVSLASCSPYLDLTIVPTIAPATRTRIPATATPKPTATRQTSPTCTVRTGIAAGALNMRTGAGVRYGVVRVLREGEILKVIERATWLKVIDAKGNQGYINPKYCK